MEQISLIQFFVVVMLGGAYALIPISRLNSQSEVVEVAKPGGELSTLSVRECESA